MLRATERLIAGRCAGRHRVPAVHGGQEGPGLLPLPGPGGGAVVHRDERAADLHRRPGRGRRRAHPVRRRGGRPGGGGLHPLPVGRDPEGGGAPAAPADRSPRGGRRRGADEAPTADADGPARATPSSSPTPPSCSRPWPRGRPRRRSSAPCSRRRPRRSPPASGPWPRPPTTPAS